MDTTENIDDIVQKANFISKELWEAAINGLMAATPIFEKFFKSMDFDGRGAAHAAIFLRDIHMAICAMQYVSEFARDKVRLAALNEEDYKKAQQYIAGLAKERMVT
jgi:hypothetical protein